MIWNFIGFFLVSFRRRIDQNSTIECWWWRGGHQWTDTKSLDNPCYTSPIQRRFAPPTGRSTIQWWKMRDYVKNIICTFSIFSCVAYKQHQCPHQRTIRSIECSIVVLKEYAGKKFNELLWMRINIYLNNYNNRKRIARMNSSKTKLLRFQIE